MKIIQRFRIDETTASTTNNKISGWTVDSNGKDIGHCIIAWPNNVPLPLLGETILTFEVSE
jgi:hypothetical protein